MILPLLAPFHATSFTELSHRQPYERVDWLIVCGSGIHDALLEPEFAEQQGFVVEHTIPLADVHLPAPHVPGHGQALVYGRLGELKICLQTGRLHPYEGHEVQLCVAAMQAVLARGVGRSACVAWRVVCGAWRGLAWRGVAWGGVV